MTRKGRGERKALKLKDSHTEKATRIKLFSTLRKLEISKKMQVAKTEAASF